MKEILSYDNCRKTVFPHTEESYDTYRDERVDKKLYDFGDFNNYNPPRRDMVEILAPASKNTYKQAVHGGADAIYFGYGEFNARAGGDNFDSLKEVVDFCHFYNVKAYLALNISFKQSELAQVKDIIIEAEEANLDAFIITDLALVPMIRKYSDAAIHASTQLGTHNSWGMDFLFDMGIDRAVLSREMTFDDIANVTDTEAVDTEVFIHGALCSCFSGGCLLSSMLTGNSANRGKCNQLCRRFYRSYIDGTPGESGYLLSAKDICLDKYMDDLIDIGVKSLKIEGRLKRAEYVAGVTFYYSELKKKKTPFLTKDDVKALFNRGDFTPGYFEGNDVIYTPQPNHIGIYAGKIVCLGKKNEAYVKAIMPLVPENGYKLLRNNKEIGGAVATGETKNGFYAIKSNGPLHVGDILRLTGNAELAEFVTQREKKKNIFLDIRIAEGEQPRIIMNIKGNKYTYTGKDFVQGAINHPITEEEIRNLFEGSKVREIKFKIINIELFNAFLTKAQQNALRRDVLDCVWEFLLGYYDRNSRIFEDKPIPKYTQTNKEKGQGDYCEVDTFEKYVLVRNFARNIVYSPKEYSLQGCRAFYKNVKNENNRVFLKLPIYIPTTKEDFFIGLIKIFDGVLTNNIGGVYIAEKLGKLCVCGQNMNITNTKNWLIKNTSDQIISPELRYSDVKKFEDPLVYAYGNLPLMYLNFCPRKVAGLMCGDCDRELRYNDDNGSYLITTQKFKGYCEHMLHNDRLTDIGTEYSVRKYFDFTLASFAEIKRIVAVYSSGEYKPENTNKLHLTRGVN